VCADLSTPSSRSRIGPRALLLTGGPGSAGARTSWPDPLATDAGAGSARAGSVVASLAAGSGTRWNKKVLISSISCLAERQPISNIPHLSPNWAWERPRWSSSDMVVRSEGVFFSFTILAHPMEPRLGDSF